MSVITKRIPQHTSLPTARGMTKPRQSATVPTGMPPPLWRSGVSTTRASEPGVSPQNGVMVPAKTPKEIVTRIFQGNHWLFQCETECGPAIVIRQNDGKPQPAEGEAVRLSWRSEDMSLRGGGAAA